MDPHPARGFRQAVPLASQGCRVYRSWRARVSSWGSAPVQRHERRADREDRRREEQSERETDRGHERDDAELALSDLRGRVKAELSRQTDGSEDPEPTAG